MELTNNELLTIIATFEELIDELSEHNRGTLFTEQFEVYNKIKEHLNK